MSKAYGDKYKRQTGRSYGSYVQSLKADHYDDLFEAQQGRCAICGRKEGRRHLCMDHDHGTGEPRGLLCAQCNLGLGMFKDSPRLLAHAIVYLEERGSKW